jgi:hypothetical protein
MSALGPRRRERYGLLLAALLLAFALQGAIPQSAGVNLLVTALQGAALVLALWAADVRRSGVLAAIVLAVLLLGIGAVGVAVSGQESGVTRLADLLLVALAPPAVVLGVVRTLKRRGSVTVEAVFGVLCLYILLGMFFAYAYGAIDALGGEPFFASGASATPSNDLYFSFTTLTTVGYGDLVARAPLGHTLAVFEALLGQIYLVTVVAVLVSNLRRPSTGSPSPPASAPPR